MNVKTYQGSSIAEALSKVKQELGSGAVILHTRSYKRGGVMGFGARQVVEITAGLERKGTGARVGSASRGRALAGVGANQSSPPSPGGGASRAEAVRHPLRSAY